MLKIEKKYNPKKEIEILNSKQERKNKKSDFSILTTPVNISEKIKYADVLTQIRTDIFLKYFTLQWEEISSPSLWGIPSDSLELAQKDKNDLISLFVKNIEYSSKKLKRLWIYTNKIDKINIWEENSHRVRNLFAEKQKDGAFFDEECVNYRSIDRQTVISRQEINFKSIKRKKYSIKYFVDTKKDCLTISTFYPETIFADVALAVNPIDRRYKKLIWSKVIIPIINKTIPIVWDESVDMQNDSGIIRVTPAHDKWWLEIAIRHKLPTNKVAIDHLGLFTDNAWVFAGKKMIDFRDNVIQYLDDICNLGNVQDIQTDIAIHKETWEELGEFISKQRFIKISEENISSILNEDFHITSGNQQKIIFDSEFQNIKQICISNNQSFWVSMPIRSDSDNKKYIISDDTISQSYKKNWKWKKILLTLIIFNLYTDNRINKKFWWEEILDLLISPSLESWQRVIDVYLQIYKDYFKSNDLPKTFQKELEEFAEIIKTSDKSNISYVEKFADNIIKYLSKSFMINELPDQNYILDIRSIFNKDLDKEHLTFDNNILNSVLMLHNLWYMSGKSNKNKTNFLVLPPDQTMNTIKSMLLNTQIQPSFDFKYIFVLDHIDHKEKNKIWFSKSAFINMSEITENSWWDVSRLLFLFSQQNKITETDISNYENLINKIRNAARFIILQSDPKKRKRHFDKIQKEAEKEKDISLYDQRIIHKIKDFYQEYKYMFSTLDIIDLLPKLEHLVRYDFCEKYLEIQKIHPSKNIEIYWFFVIWLICKIIYPFMPFLSQSIWNTCLFEWEVEDDKFLDFFPESEKNYKTQLIIDIIDKIKHIKQRKNWDKNNNIKICISTSPDLIEYISIHEWIIKKITYAEELEYQKNTSLDNLWYELENLINIIVWIKRIDSKNKIQEKSLSDLERELQSYVEEMQMLRSVISALSFRSDHDSQEQLEERKKELTKVKKKIEHKELEIFTFKTNKS